MASAHVFGTYSALAVAVTSGATNPACVKLICVSLMMDQKPYAVLFHAYTCRLVGTIPAGLGMLDKLEAVDLSNNLLTGFLPEISVQMPDVKLVYDPTSHTFIALLLNDPDHRQGSLHCISMCICIA